MAAPWTPLMPDREMSQLRSALREFTVDDVHRKLGPVGQAALARGDLSGVARALRSSDDPTATLIRLFLLGAEVPEAAASAALHPLPLEAARAAGFVETSAGSARAVLDLRPYTEAASAGPDETPAASWWVVSDFGSDVRPGPLAHDHVLGVGTASLTLAQATPREPVPRVLDIGTGCGVQALHASRHADSVCATDISRRALRLAATTAALSGEAWDLRHGSLLDPVAGEQFDLVVANPPFVISPGTHAYDYRDGRMAGDDFCRSLLTGIPKALCPSGTAVMLANWIIPREVDWQERLSGWLADSECDAWVWQREVAEPGEYVAMWLRDAGEVPGSAAWSARYGAWCDFFDATGVAAVGMGLAVLWRTDASEPVRVLEDVPQPLEQPIGTHMLGWITSRRRLAAASDDDLLHASLRPADGLVRTRDDVLGTDGWSTDRSRLRQSRGLRWEVDVDDAIASLLAGLNGKVPLLAPLTVLAGVLDVPLDEVTRGALPVVRDLIGRGFVELP